MDDESIIRQFKNLKEKEMRLFSEADATEDLNEYLDEPSCRWMCYSCGAFQKDEVESCENCSCPRF